MGEKLLEERKEGWDFVAKNRKTGNWRQLYRFHYFKDGISLCGKYEIDKNNTSLLSSSALSVEDCCKICLRNKKIERGENNKQNK